MVIEGIKSISGVCIGAVAAKFAVAGAGVAVAVAWKPSGTLYTFFWFKVPLQ